MMATSRDIRTFAMNGARNYIISAMDYIGAEH